MAIPAHVPYVITLLEDIRILTLVGYGRVGVGFLDAVHEDKARHSRGV